VDVQPGENVGKGVGLPGVAVGGRPAADEFMVMEASIIPTMETNTRIFIPARARDLI